MGSFMFYVTGAVMITVLVQDSLSQISSLRAKQKDLISRDRFQFFDMELLTTMMDSEPEGNVMISPASVKAALAMILEGSGGYTAEELRKYLRLPEDEKTIRAHFKNFLNSLQVNNLSNKVETANLIFFSNTILQNLQYISIMKNDYMSEMEKVDFSKPVLVADTINRWVNMLTHGLIPSLVEPGSLNANTKLMLANAMYFKGKWKYAFDFDNTLVKCFYVGVNQCMDTYLMESVNIYKYAHIPSLNAYAVELPYEGNQFAMLLLLPGNTNAIKQLEIDLRHITLNTIVSALEPTDLVVSVPRFKITFNTDLTPALNKVGISDIFTTTANLTGMIQSGSPALHISNILHKVKLEVNEEGTIAAAATGSLVVPLMGTTIPKIIFNHPFLFFLRNIETGDILFAGRVTEPDVATNVDLDIRYGPQNSQGTAKPVGSTTLNPVVNNGNSNAFNPDTSTSNYKPPYNTYNPASSVGSNTYNPASSVGSNTYNPASSVGSNTYNQTTSGSNTYSPLATSGNVYNQPISGSNVYNPSPSGSNSYNPGVPLSNVYNQPSSGSNIYNPESSGSNTYSTNISRLPASQGSNINYSSARNVNIENNANPTVNSQLKRFISPLPLRITGNNPSQTNVAPNQPNINSGSYEVTRLSPVPTQYSPRSGSYAYATNSAQYVPVMNEGNGVASLNQSDKDKIHFQS